MPAALVRPAAWGLRKPPLGAQINWGHPLAAGLVFAVLLDNDHVASAGDYVRHLKPITAVTSGLGVAVAGGTGRSMSQQGAKFDGTSTMGVSFGNVPGLGVNSRDISVAAGAWITATGTTQIVVGRDSDTLGRGFDLYYDGTSWSWGTANDTSVTNTTAVANRYYSLLGTWNLATTTNSLWVDGIGASVAALPGTGPQSNTAALWLGRRARAGDEKYLSGGIAYTYVWNRTLRPTEAAWFQAEPYAFFMPPGPKVLYFDLGGTGVVSVPATPATVTVAAQALGLTTGAATVALTAATVTTTAVALVRTGAATLPLATATGTTAAQALGITAGTSSRALTPATVGTSAIGLGISSLAGDAVPATPATVTVAAQALAITVGATTAALAPAVVTTTAGALARTGAATVALSSATVTTSAVLLTTTGAASRVLIPAAVATSALPLGVSSLESLPDTTPYYTAQHRLVGTVTYSLTATRGRRLEGRRNYRRRS